MTASSRPAGRSAERTAAQARARGALLPPLPSLAAAYVAGVVAATGFEGGPFPLAAACLAIAAAAVVLGGRGAILPAVAALGLAATGYVRLQAASEAPPPALAALRGEHVVEGVVRSEPVRGGGVATLELDVTRLDGRAADGGLRLTYAPGAEPPLAGDRIAVRGEIEAPPALEGAAEGFDYAAYLRARGVHAVMAFPRELRVTARDTGTPLDRALRALHGRTVANIERALPEPEAALAAGMLLGERRALPRALQDDLRATGTSHLVVVSGQNVALVLGTLVALLTAVVSRRQAAVLALASIPAYVLFVGGEPPVVRAALMAAGITVAGVTGRRTPGWVYLVYAAAAMLAADPLLVRDLAFQLSATATAGVLLVAPVLRDALARPLRLRSSVSLALAEAAATTTAATLAVLPVQVVAFDTLSPTSIPANVLAAPLYEATLLVALAAAALGWLDPVADLLFVAASAAPALFVDLVTWLGRVPSVRLDVGAPLAFATAWWNLLAAATWWTQRVRSVHVDAPGRGRLSTVVLAVAAGGVWLAALQPAAEGPSLTVLDVGQGLAVLVRSGDAAVLIDAGPPDEAVLDALPRGTPRQLDAAVITHPDIDHAGGVAGLRSRGRVRRVLASPDEVALIEGGAAPLDIGDRIHLDERAWLEVLGPPPDVAKFDGDNDRSMVLMVHLGDARVLLPADVEAAGEAWLVRSGQDLDADAVVVPHHGSRTSSTPAFIEATSPTVAVISSGAGNTYGHPHPEVVQRYAAAGAILLLTAERGSVTLRAGPNGLEVTTAR